MGLKPDAVAALAAPDRARIDAALAWAEQPGAHILTPSDPRYPALLAEIADAPTVLFVRGDPLLLAEPQIAIVGSRNPTPVGREVTRELASRLAACGLVITSGLICFDLSTIGTACRRSTSSLFFKSSLLQGLWVCGREARECGQPVGRACAVLAFCAEASARSIGCPHGSARAAPQGCGLVHISTGRSRPWYKHIGSGHPGQIATVDHADMRGLSTT